MSLLNRPTTAFPVEQEEKLDRLPKTSSPPTKSAAAKRAAPVEDSLRYSSILGSSNALRQIQIEVDQPIKRTEDLFRRPLPPPVAVPEKTPSPPAQPTSTRSPRSENTTPSNRSISTPTTTCPTPRQSQSPHYHIMRLDSPAIQALLAPGPSQQSASPKISNINNIRFIKQSRNSRSSLQKSRPAAYSYHPYSEEAGPSRQSASLMTKSCRAVSEPNTINLDTKSGPVVYNFPPLHSQNHYFEEAGPSRVRYSSIPTDSQPPIYPVDVEEMSDEINRAMYLRYALEPSTHEHQLCADLIENVGSYHRMRAEYKKLLKSLDSFEKRYSMKSTKKGKRKD